VAEDSLGLFGATSKGGSAALWVFFFEFLPKTSPINMVSAAPKASFTSATFALLPISSELLVACIVKDSKG
jgi:hypothetical protein